ncbi:MAG TPA: acetate--CoA ligase family protein [Acidimicrobiales bacterium]
MSGSPNGSTAVDAAPGIAGLLRPRSVAIVGASERSLWCQSLVHNLDSLGFDGDLHLVNPRGGVLNGRPVVENLGALAGHGIDTAFVLLKGDRVLPALEQAAEIGVRNAVVLASGFAEAGDAGRERQAAITRLAAESGMAVLGPNSIGTLNLVDGVGLFASGLEGLPPAGGVALVSQSGGMARALVALAAARDIGMSHVVTTGNESVVDAATAVDTLVDEPSTRCIALFVEAIRDPQRFVRAARRAERAGVPLVVLKVGRSEAGRKVSAAHTGSLAGDPAVVAGVLRQLGAVAVDSFEDLIGTAGLLAHTGRLPGRRVAFLSGSGGRCNVIADTAEAAGVPLAPLSPPTAAAVGATLGTELTVTNPLDVTGAFVTDRTVFGRILESVAGDPELDVIVVGLDLPERSTPAAARLEELFGDLRAIAARSATPILVMETFHSELNEERRAVRRRLGLDHTLNGVRHGMTALAGALWWSARPAPVEVADAADGGDAGAGAVAAVQPGRPLSEWDARRVLEPFGVPFVPADLATTVDEAVESARRIDGPVVMKVCSPQLTHKTEHGGVLLGVDGDGEVAAGFDRLVRSAAEHIGSKPEGVLVSPQRPPGVELIVGTSDHPEWGPLLTVGLGGVWAEALRDTAWRVLPVTRHDVEDMLGELRGAALLDGWRGQPAADRDRLVDAVLAIAAAGQRLAGRVAAVEVNPLLVRGSLVEGLDALVVARED